VTIQGSIKIDKEFYNCHSKILWALQEFLIKVLVLK